MLIIQSKVNTTMGETGCQQGMKQRQEEEGRHEKERRIRRDRKNKSRKERRPIKA